MKLTPAVSSYWNLKFGKKGEWNWVFKRLNVRGWKTLPPMDVVQSYSYGMHIMAYLILFVSVVLALQYL